MGRVQRDLRESWSAGERRRQPLAQNLGDAPEVRKARGVYYTPAHIVDYIVRNTIGPLLAGSSPRIEKPGPLRILDPACGTGAFLLGAYQFLLDWHAARARRQSKIQNPKSKISRHGRSLTFQDKKRILLDHVYGLDIDPQAVEATRRSLLAMLLEGEPAQTMGPLPSLGRNIKCGHALIGPDFPDRRRLKPFDWSAEFPQVLGTPGAGFEAIIGNPPYLSFSGRHAVEISPAERAYLARRYRSGGWPTAHGLFIEQCATHLSRRFLAFVVPDQLGHLAGYGDVRRILLERHGLREVRYWGEDVFAGAVTPALTFIADAEYAGPTTIYDADGRRSTVCCRAGEPWVAGRTSALLAKIRQNSVSLGPLVADPGVHTGNCSAKLIGPWADGAPRQVPILEGRQIARYRCGSPRKALRLDYRPEKGEYFTIRDKQRYTAARFVIRQTASYPIVGPRRRAAYFRNSLLALYAPRDGTDVRYLVGLLNSRLMRYVFTRIVRESQQKAFPQVKVRALRALPIRPIDFRNPADVALHAQLVGLVQRMLARPTEATDREIDQLVYGLYGLTEEEMRSVAQATE